jgi:hypothetical protein
MIDFRPEFLLPFVLYAETHYKFKGIYSRLFKNEPEIIADAPFRVEPGQPIPILILVKDAHRFPIEILKILIEIKQNDQLISKKSIPLNLSIYDDCFWHRIFFLERPADLAGLVEIDVLIIIKSNGKIKKYHNDNCRISSHQPLKVYLAKDPLPRFDNWYFGDFHYHSNYTEDQVEFGAPLAATVEMARASGLNFFAVTDHSYDLDDLEDSWIENDHNISKWHKLWQEVNELNNHLSNFVILPGEEVSAGNHRNRNIHLLVINNKNFIHGKGDSAERWFRTRPDFSLEQILNQVDEAALAIAGHPEIPTPFLQWLLIRRGRWQWQDFQNHRLNGFQIWNGEYDRTFHQGSSNWVKLLLAGKKLGLIAGNDAHGNFNRFRQIGFPFFTFRESLSQIFGNMKTGVKLNKNLNQQNLVHAVKCNHVLITNGPIIDFLIQNEQKQTAMIGDEIEGDDLILNITAKSSPEFGKLELIQLLRGDLNTRKEICEFVIRNFVNPYHFLMEQKLNNMSKCTYFRAELMTRKTDGQIARCLTNPIWIKKKI